MRWPTSVSNKRLVNGFKIYPNPSRDKFQIINSQDYKIKKIVLFDMSGGIVKTFPKENKELQVKGIAAGQYLLNIETDKGRFTQQVQILD